MDTCSVALCWVPLSLLEWHKAVRHGYSMAREEKRLQDAEGLEKLCSEAEGGQGRKRMKTGVPGAPGECQQAPAVDWGDDEVEEHDAVCDVLAAIRLLRSEFPMCPFVLKSHVYTIVRDKTDADVELDHLRRTNAIRVLHIPTEWDEGYVETSEYCNVIQNCMEGCSGRLRSVLEWFKDDVVPRHTASTIAEEDLKRWLSVPKGMEGKGVRRGVTDKDIDLLMQQSLLQRDSSLSCHEQRFVFSLPGSGHVVKSLLAGRRELLSIVKRKKYGQMLQSKIQQIKLKSSHLNIGWHLKDLIGSGVVHVEDTTVGPLIRVVQDS